MADSTIYLSYRTGLQKPPGPAEQAATLTALKANRAAGERQATLIASIPPHELRVLRGFYGREPTALVAAWEATQKFRAEQAGRTAGETERRNERVWMGR